MVTASKSPFLAVIAQVKLSLLFDLFQSLLEQVQILSEEKEKLKNFISDLEEQLASVTTAASEEKQVRMWALRDKIFRCSWQNERSLKQKQFVWKIDAGFQLQYAGHDNF